MNIQFLEPAQTEFTETINYYNAQAEGLGFEFSDEIQATIDKIIAVMHLHREPKSWRTRVPKRQQ